MEIYPPRMVQGDKTHPVNLDQTSRLWELKGFKEFFSTLELKLVKHSSDTALGQILQSLPPSLKVALYCSESTPGMGTAMV